MSLPASMPADLVQLVGQRVLAGDLLDYVCFRAVCAHWRSSTICPRGRGITDSRFHPRRWMMLPDGHGLHLRDGRKRFLNLDTGVFVRTRVPLLEDHVILCPVEGLLLLHRQYWQYGDQHNSICLLHPFTGDVARFPPITYHTITLGSNPSGMHYYLLPGSATASLSISAKGVAMMMMVLSRTRRVLFATTKDKQWSFSSWSFSTDETNISSLYESIISSQGKLYMVRKFISTGEVQILRIDPPREEMSGFSSSWFPSLKIIPVCASLICNPFGLVEHDSEILLVAFMGVYRIADLILGRIIPLTSIGDNALLMGFERSRCAIGWSLSVSIKAMPTITGDTIIRSHPLSDRTLGQYHLNRSSWSPRAERCLKYDGNMSCTCSTIHLINHMYGVCHCAVNR
ncbi:hypothetical protein VPH35_023683 [Triticum aestivum]